MNEDLQHRILKRIRKIGRRVENFGELGLETLFSTDERQFLADERGSATVCAVPEYGYQGVCLRSRFWTEAHPQDELTRKSLFFAAKAGAFTGKPRQRKVPDREFFRHRLDQVTRYPSAG